MPFYTNLWSNASNYNKRKNVESNIEYNRDSYDELYEETDKLYEKKQSESITYSNLFKTSSLAAASYVMEKYMEGFCFKCNSKVKVNNYLNNCIECQSEFVELYH